MSITDGLIIGAFFALLIPEQSRIAANVILLFNFVYFLFVIDLDWNYYYIASATLNTAIGVILFSRYRVVSILSFLLIPTNFIGYTMYKYYYEPTIYDNICLTIIILQILMLTIRGLLNGIDKRLNNDSLVFLVNFDSNKNHAKIQKRGQG